MNHALVLFSNPEVATSSPCFKCAMLGFVSFMCVISLQCLLSFYGELVLELLINYIPNSMLSFSCAGLEQKVSTMLRKVHDI